MSNRLYLIDNDINTIFTFRREDENIVKFFFDNIIGDPWEYGENFDFYVNNIKCLQIATDISNLSEELQEKLNSEKRYYKWRVTTDNFKKGYYDLIPLIMEDREEEENKILLVNDDNSFNINILNLTQYPFTPIQKQLLLQLSTFYLNDIELIISRKD